MAHPDSKEKSSEKSSENLNSKDSNLGLKQRRTRRYGYHPLWGAWIPLWLPKSSLTISILLVFCSCITSTTFGYDASMVNGLNILPSYTTYFHLTPLTTGLNTASLWIGGCLAGLTFPPLTDTLGRRPALLHAALLTLLAVILQSAAQTTGMFVCARILLGYGTSASGLVGPAYLAETLGSRWRAWGLGVFNDFYYVGGLVAAGITYATSFKFDVHSTWAWRLPSLIQGVFSLVCVAIIPFIPESPRWLVHQGRVDEAREVLVRTMVGVGAGAGGDAGGDAGVEEELRAIVGALEGEERRTREGRGKMGVWEVVRTPDARKRVALAVSAAVFSTIAGNVISSYYLGTMLTNAGITSATTQLQINIILNAFCLLCSLFGTYIIDVWGRKPTAVVSTALLTVFLFLVGGLTKAFGSSTNTPGIYATVAAIFLFQGTYSVGWTPILYLYPPEVLSYRIRASGMGVFQVWLNGTAILIVFTMPLALNKLAWKTYMINGAWDVVVLGLIVRYWVETKGRGLEGVEVGGGGGGGEEGGKGGKGGVEAGEGDDVEVEEKEKEKTGSSVMEDRRDLEEESIRELVT